MAINNDEADIETCPLALAKTFMPSKSTQKNPLREPVSKPAEKAPDLGLPTLQPPVPNPHLTPYRPVSYYPFGHPYLPPPYLHTREHSPPSPHVSRRNFQPSSPMSFETDADTDKLTKYFAWLSQCYPAMKQQLEECLVTLKGEEIIFGTLLDIPVELWKEWRVSNGVMIMVKGHTKKYERKAIKKHT